MTSEFSENAEQRMAFDFYFRLGAARSLAMVAGQTGKHINTLKNWSRDHRWQERVVERERATADHSKDVQAVLQEQDLKTKHVKIYDIAITKAVQQLAEGSVKITKMSELIQLINARWKLAQQPAPSTATVTNMQFNGPTKVDLGLERMGREEKIKFVRDMLQGIMRVQTRPRMGERATIPATVTEPVE